MACSRMSVSLVKICRIDRYPQKQGSHPAQGKHGEGGLRPKKVDIRSGARKPTVGILTGRDGARRDRGRGKKKKTVGIWADNVRPHRSHEMELQMEPGDAPSVPPVAESHEKVLHPCLGGKEEESTG